MSVTSLISPSKPTPSSAALDTAALPLFRMSADTYKAMTASAALGPDDHVELLEGLLAQRLSKNPPHEAAITRLQRRLLRTLPESVLLRQQAPIDLGESLTEPDLSIVRASPDDCAQRHPTAADTLLVVEVSDNSRKTDLTTKLRIYAQAGIPRYWVVNLLDRRIELYSQPDPAATPPTYNLRQPFGPDTSVPLSLPDITPASIPVADLLP